MIAREDKRALYVSADDCRDIRFGGISDQTRLLLAVSNLVDYHAYSGFSYRRHIHMALVEKQIRRMVGGCI